MSNAAGELAEAVREIRAALDAATGDGGPACGLGTAGGAFERMRQAWLTELAAHAALLDELSGAGDGQ